MQLELYFLESEDHRDRHLCLCSFYHGDHDGWDLDIHDVQSDLTVRDDRTVEGDVDLEEDIDLEDNVDHGVEEAVLDIRRARPDSPDERAVEENDSGGSVTVRGIPDLVVLMGKPVRVLEDSHHIVGVVHLVLHIVVAVLHVPVVVLKGQHLAERMVHFDSVVVVHLENVLGSDMVHQPWEAVLLVANSFFYFSN